MLFRKIGVEFSSFAVITERYVGRFGIWGLFAYFLLSGAATFFFVPRQLLSLVAGYFYGTPLAVFTVSFGAGLGCLLSMGYGNFLAKNFFQKNMKPRMRCLETIFTKSTFGIALGIRIMPVGSNTFLNMLAGAAKIPFWSFWAGSVIGYIPQNYLFALLGNAGKTESPLPLVQSVFLYAVLFCTGFLIVKKNLPGHVTLKYLYDGIVRGEE
ncbi:MAG: VTT domain-containing protein [Mailhella sp.]|nr:VTT domain-containing protein [Mailhella sp.]